MIPALLLIFLYSCEVESGSGLGMRLLPDGCWEVRESQNISGTGGVTWNSAMDVGTEHGTIGHPSLPVFTFISSFPFLSPFPSTPSFPFH